MTELIVSFDIGKKNFAFVIEEIDKEKLKNIENIPKKDRYNKDGTCTTDFLDLINKLYDCGSIKLICNLDLTYNCNPKKYLDHRTFINMTNELDKYREYWMNCSTFIIERQMGFKNKRNTMALKLGQHCYSYFSIFYPEKDIIDYPAYHKTQVLGAPKKFGTITKNYKNGNTREIKDNRKKWSCRIAKSILEIRNDSNSLEIYDNSTKKDDISDCMLMNITYCYLKFIDKRTLK